MDTQKKSLTINITSTLVEKGVDIAKDFLGKLIGPGVEEAGLLIKDQMTYFKFKNQVTILNKAKAHCDKNNISPKQISLKLLCPLLDNCALEEDEFLQDKWANLIANLVDSDQNIENHVFPYILSQISKIEFIRIDGLYKKKQLDNKALKQELEEFEFEKEQLLTDIQNKIKLIETQISLPETKTKFELYNKNGISKRN